tara:strand:- start:7235 stop:7402 length:168 start_codon:yes stop_codon:yes gene_type:complete
MIAVILRKLNNIEHDIKILKTDVQYLKLKETCKEHRDKPKEEPISTGWIGWRGIL